MTSRSDGRPLLVAVDDDASRRALLQTELARRYGAAYRPALTATVSGTIVPRIKLEIEALARRRGADSARRS
jgi:hypothetical protein